MSTRTKSLAIIPPASLTPDRAVEFLDSSAEAINDYERALGGRTELVATLSLDHSAEMQNLVRMLNDHQFDRRSLGFLCRQVGITLSDLFRAFRNGTLAKAQILASRKIAERLLPVVEDIMARAAPHDEDCATCDGTGEVTPKPSKRDAEPKPASCRVCNGKGKIRRLPDLDRQRLALELAEMIKPPRGGNQILNQLNVGSPSAAREVAAGSLEQMQQAVTQLLYGQDSEDDIVDLIPEERDAGDNAEG